MSRITCRGASGVPAAVAGQTSVQRPHSVHENASSTCFQLKSASAAIPDEPLGRRLEGGDGSSRTCVIAERPLHAAGRELARRRRSGSL